jgi:hypothetical protein
MESKSYQEIVDHSGYTYNEVKSFIQNGKTENVIVDGLLFDLASEPWVQNYFGLEFWYFKLRRKN